MYKIDSDGATVDNRFTDGDSELGTPATVLPAEYLNMVQDELAKLLAAAEIDFDKADNTQILQSLDSRYGRIPAGTRMAFVQSSAPTGWTKITGMDGRGLRLVDDDSGGGVGGTSDAFAAHSHTVGAHSHGHTFAVAGRTLSVSQMPSHRHSATTRTTAHAQSTGSYLTNSSDYTTGNAANTNYEGGGGSHNHSLSGGVSNSASFNSGSFAPKFVNAIVCGKD